MFKLFTDTDTDLLPSEAAELGYTLISMPYVIDEKEIYPYVDFDEFDYGKFYGDLRRGTMPSTCALSPAQYVEYFEPAMKEGFDVLYVHFSAAMSGTFNSMNIAIKELSERYPERRVYTVDTKGITICSLNIVKEIGDMAKAGATVGEILEWARVEVDKFAVYFYADDLKFFARSGRVGNLSAVMGNLIGLRPILTMNSEGRMVTAAKAKGKRATVRKILEYVEELAEDIADHRVIVGHADALPLAEELVTELKARYGDSLRCEIAVVNPTAGSHCGPDTVGVCFHAKHR